MADARWCFLNPRGAAHALVGEVPLCGYRVRPYHSIAEAGADLDDARKCGKCEAKIRVDITDAGRAALMSPTQQSAHAQQLGMELATTRIVAFLRSATGDEDDEARAEVLRFADAIEKGEHLK